MAATVDIWNRALQKLGAKRVSTVSENSVSSRACEACYDSLRRALLRSHVWTFAVKRAELAADASGPDWGRANAFQLPSDFVRKAPPYTEDVTNYDDWEIEGGKILTNDDAPLYLRYVSDVTDPNLMDPLFLEALACKMALEMSEQLTQSNVKKTDLRADMKDIMAEARRTNAIERPSDIPCEDEYVTCRN